VGPFGDLSETRGEACDASQILSDRAENHKRVLFTKLLYATDTRVAAPARARERASERPPTQAPPTRACPVD